MVAQAIKSLTDAENEVLLQLHSHHLYSLHVLLTMPTCHCDSDYTSCHIIHVAVCKHIHFPIMCRLMGIIEVTSVHSSIAC